MNIAAVKVELAKQLLSTQNTGLIKHIQAIFETQEKDFWNELPNEIKLSAQKAMKQADKGEFKTHEEVMKKVGKWRKK